VAIKSFEIVSVPVSEPQRSKQFYRNVLGFDLVREMPMGPGQRWIQLAPPGCSTTIAILNVSDIDADHHELSGRGLKLTEIKQEPWGRYAMFSDPDGNGWILRQPPG